MRITRRDFIKSAGLGAAAWASGFAGPGLSAGGRTRIPGANDRVRVGIVGFSDRARHSLIPSFLAHGRDQFRDRRRIGYLEPPAQ